MKKRFNLTPISLLLVAGALAIPSEFWYIIGCHEAEQRGVQMRNEQWQRARDTGLQLAERVRTRLETLRETESRRPFYHYQSYYHDPKGASEGAAVVPSPLAQGPSDPLINAYFQIDGAGELTMPMWNEDIAREDSEEQLTAHWALQSNLQSVVPACEVWAQQMPSGSKLAQQSAQIPQRQKVEELQSEAYQQNVVATKLYADIKGGKLSQNDPYGLKSQPPSQKEQVVRVGVDDFRWHTMKLENEPTLFGLRCVTTPQGPLVQGFVISSVALEESFKGAAFPVRFTRTVPVKDGQLSMAIADTEWRVAVDATREIASARATADAIRSRFFQTFFTGLILASIAGLCVVGLFWQMEKLARERSQFAASAAHELRTPLAGLRIYSEMLAEGLGDPARAKEYARRVASEAERLGRVVANVLGFTRLERGTLKVHPQLGDLGSAVRESVARQRTALEAAGAVIELAIADGLPAVRFDRDAVGEILQNLLDNAEKHTRSARNRTIRVALGLENAAGQAARALILSVSDHGPGLPTEVRRNLFRPFTRGKSEDAPAGLGLGLVLAQALARAQGSQIIYRDAPGGGAIFIVAFPVAA